MRRLGFIFVGFVVALVLVPSAFGAGGSASQGYGGSGGNVQKQVGPASGALTAHGTGGLPFTGLDLGLLVAGGVVLVVVGAGLRRAAKRTT